MRKFRTFNIFMLTLLTLSVCSCKKYLNLKPQDGITQQDFWQTKEQVQSAVIGCYTGLLTASSSGHTIPDFMFMWGELRADMITASASATLGVSNDELNVISDNILPTNRVADWAAFYRVINYCNTVIDYAPNVLKTDKTFTPTQLNSYLAEALTIRSLLYFYLVRSFGDVPLKIKSTTTDNDLVQLTKSSQKDVLAQIVNDLNTAEGYAVISYGNNAYDKGRVTKYTVNALQADVYLWMDRYADCITKCDQIINSGRFGLVAGDAGWFNTLYVNGNSNESIFELQFDNQLLNPFYNMFLTGTKRYLAEPNIIDDFYGVDNIDDNDKDIRGADAAVHPADLSIWKYVGLTPTTSRTPDISYAHWIVYRYADILLMKAEACANSSRGQDALDLIDQIRTRAHALTSNGNTVQGTDQHPDPTDVNGLTDYIVAERAREFAFEGKRWYDVLRNAKRNNYARIDILINAIARSVPPDMQQSAINKFLDHNSHYFPIYQYELTTDPNLVQNPFYK